MQLSDFDLQQLEEATIGELPSAQKEILLVKLLHDLKEARERLKANSQTSSRPPSSDAPWTKRSTVAEEADAESAPTDAASGDGPATEPTVTDSPAPPEAAAKGTSGQEDSSGRTAGRQRGAKGYSRRVTLPVSATVVHRPEQCVRCEQALEAHGFVATTGHYVLDLEVETGRGLGGLRVRHEKHVYGEIVCTCGHRTRSAPGCCADDPLWQVSLSEWHLVGPQLVSLMVCLSQRMRLSRARIQEFLLDWLAVELSTGAINQCIHEAGRAVEPIEEQLIEELRQEVLAHADETPWKEWGELLWLWVISTPTVCLYVIGYRSRELLDSILGEDFAGWLMSDGYAAYRHFQKRLRCWAHLLRKALGLKLSLHAEARRFGRTSHALLKELMAAVYAARAGPAGDLCERYRQRLADFRRLCEQHSDSTHEKTRALAREFLNDWEAIWIVLAHPHLPMTNNEAERALRHWVITRLLSHGTRTAQGSRVLGLLASVIETCRKRQLSPWPYLASVIAARRKGEVAPPLPAAPSV